MSHSARIWNGQFKKALALENPDPLLDVLLGEMGIEVERVDRAMSEDELIERLASGGHDLIYKRSRTPITKAVIEASRSLAAVMLCCIGDDSVDKQAAATNGVLVLNDPVSNGRSVAELVVGEMICLARRVFEAVNETNLHRFTKSNAGRYEVAGKTLGIFGLGNIGKQVAQLGEKLEMEVCFFDTREVACEVGIAMGWSMCNSLVELFERSHVVSVHTSAHDWHGQSNRGVLKYEHFRAMRQDNKIGPRVFINAARGILYDPQDLTRALHEGHVHSCFVDVFPTEPRSGDDAWVNPYADTPTAFSTPHIGAATKEAQPRIARHIATTTRLLNHTGSIRDCTFRPGRMIAVNPRSGRTVLSVVHSDARGTKKAVSDVIYQAGASNLQSTHRDFPRYGIAYDVSVIDKPLTDSQIQALIERAVELTDDPTAIRSVRQLQVP